jgi:hypothetical protein
MRKSDLIIAENAKSRATQTVWTCQHPEMEKLLYKEFIQRRAAGILVWRSFFCQKSRQLFKALYPQIESLFVFSHGWFQGFCKRWNIGLRAITQQVNTNLFS